MKISDLMQATFKKVGEELGLNISVVDGELCVKPKDPSAASEADYLIPTMRMVERCRCDEQAVFSPYIKSGLLTKEQMLRACKRYMLGRSRKGLPIFWMIDEMGTVHDGHIGNQWVSEMLRRRYPELSEYWQTTHCLFGLHLTPGMEKPVAIVEKECSAVVLSELYPECHWLATVYPVNFTIDQLEPLRGNTVTLFPCTDSTKTSYLLWRDIADQARDTYHMDISCSDILERNATAGQKERKTDLVDYLFNS
jgi:hypothetical protein